MNYDALKQLAAAHEAIDWKAVLGSIFPAATADQYANVLASRFYCFDFLTLLTVIYSE